MLKFIFTFIVIVYGLRFLGRLLLPYFLKSMVGKMERKVREQQGYTKPQQHTNVGETIIDKAPQDKPLRSKKSVGEYVDFEELD